MIKEVENFSRQALFNHYNSFDNPFMYITTKIEVTNLVNYCKIHRHFYATLGYLITKTANQIDCFKYRAKDGKIYYCDEVFSNYTQIQLDIFLYHLLTVIMNILKTLLEFKISFLKIKNILQRKIWQIYGFLLNHGFLIQDLFLFLVRISQYLNFYGINMKS